MTHDNFKCISSKRGHDSSCQLESVSTTVTTTRLRLRFLINDAGFKQQRISTYESHGSPRKNSGGAVWRVVTTYCTYNHADFHDAPPRHVPNTKYSLYVGAKSLFQRLRSDDEVQILSYAYNIWGYFCSLSLSRPSPQNNFTSADVYSIAASTFFCPHILIWKPLLLTGVSVHLLHDSLEVYPLFFLLLPPVPVFSWGILFWTFCLGAQIISIVLPQ